MDEKIQEVERKIPHIKERESGFFINGTPIMKGSTLTFNIIEGEFDGEFFDENQFEPMIEIIVSDPYQGQEQIEHTKQAQFPKNMVPIWKEILTFDILKPTDEVAIQIINNFENQKEVLAEKRFEIG